ncbi:Uncharacterised protein [Myroides odoratus]|nr:hypothetical protein Myrod_3115 [Myroides odoratus DSM 2801]EKB04952.1 hypothetical protein HMPREF9716_02983 [Myroides odoratus CIP 103059]STZ31207.1 Uncharacterised protein [Myroides odoratus]
MIILNICLVIKLTIEPEEICCIPLFMPKDFGTKKESYIPDDESDGYEFSTVCRK